MSRLSDQVEQGRLGDVAGAGGHVVGARARGRANLGLNGERVGSRSAAMLEGTTMLWIHHSTSSSRYIASRIGPQMPTPVVTASEPVYAGTVEGLRACQET